MTSTVELPLWLFILILLFALVTAASHLLFPSVRWFFRRRMEKAVARLNQRLERPIEPFKLARRHDMIQRLIYSPDVTEAIVEHAREQGIPENVAFEEAKGYAREIVPSFSASAYFGFAIRVARFLSQALYRVRLAHFDEAGLQNISKDATVVFVMNHRSNMDYVLVTYLAAERSALAYAVGEWARVWPLSRLIKAMGAYFIRRKSRNTLYRKVLARYVKLATDGGVTQAMFPEGGLSLDGAPQAPKHGLLKYIVEGFDPDGKDVVFVPVALNYDRVLEDRILMEAMKGGGRRFNARISVVTGFFFKQMWLRLRGKYHKFGYAAVSFGHPLSLAAFSKTRKGEVSEALAYALMDRIEAVVPVLPVPLVASVIEEAKAPMSRAAIETAVGERIALLDKAHVHLPRDDMAYAIEVGLRTLTERKMVLKVAGCYSVNPEQKTALAFYANSIRHLLR
ncbi:1-acyl-sn-glycerol-3-phosphate acyltransferase [Shimia thalassica]|jgi:glycerol-3-phosphate O-acyltransferase|uniref:1-acyl-sn-glycerol-3-phosphate acyltransferase n=1 Tax=Shimia thalassica TaxID=1715693 RepID=UPI0026E2F6AB|nr:1-acyl-sn-glycerol-3-phosphate acyltransferase [Shimia thalassica]MDO6478480.1 1-acyl-sn-glycerol-3-phosphate acyltransferase [Shimia thalassica]